MSRLAIRERGYRHWEGQYTGHAWRWWTIARTGIRAVITSKMRLALVLAFSFLAWIVPLALIVVVFPLTQGRGFSSRSFLEYFAATQHLFGMLMAGIVGAGLVASDRGSNALQIYLSKPLRRVDYAVGKAAVLVVWLGAVTLAPAVFLWLGGMLSGNQTTWPSEPARLLGGVVLFQTILLLVFASGILAMSSLTRSWTVAFVVWIGFYLVTTAVAGIISDVTDVEEWELVSIFFSLDNVHRYLLGASFVSPAWWMSLTVLLGFSAACLGLYVWRVFRMGVA